MTQATGGKSNALIYFLFLVPALSGFLYGYSITIVTGALGPLPNEDGQPQLAQDYALSKVLRSCFDSFPLVGAVVGSFVSYNFGGKLGRRGAILVSGILYAVGSAMVMMANFDISLILVGQIVYGIGVGLALFAAPLYIAEISPREIRGLLVAMKEVVIVIGIISGYVLTLAFQDFENGWRYMYLFPGILGAIVAISAYFAPETPRMMMLQNVSVLDKSDPESAPLIEPKAESLEKVRQVLTALRRGYPQAEIEGELDEIQESLQSVFTVNASISELFSKECLRPLLTGMLLLIFQQISGQPTVLTFAPKILQNAGFGNKALLLAIATGCFKGIVTLFAVFKADHYGRKSLLVTGTILMQVGLVFLTASFATHSPNENGEYNLSTAWSALTVLGLMLYTGGYQIGFGPIVWIIISEVFPLRVRGQAQSICITTNFLVNAFVLFTYEYVEKLIGVAGSFGIYLGMCIVSTILILGFLPETKGKSLEQIEKMFASMSLTGTVAK